MGNVNKETASEIDGMIEKAKLAMAAIEHYDQAQSDLLVKAVAWAIFNDQHARELAEMAVEDTGLGNVADKITKNKRKTLGTLADLMKEKTVGIISSEPELGIVTYGKPVGVVGTMTPSTNPAATPANQAMMALKSKNSIIISPSPSGLRTALRLKEFVDVEFAKIGAPADLFQVVGAPISFTKANYLMSVVDLLLVTGDQKNVLSGYKSGTPCIGVGKGNVPVIVDETADIEDAAKKICISKCFDNATSCSSENSVIAVDQIYGDFLKKLQKEGGFLCNAEQAEKIGNELFKGANINREFIGQSIEKLFSILGFELPSHPVKFLIIEQDGIGSDYPLSGEKLSLILTVYRAADFDEALGKTKAILAYEGIGHSVGIHTMMPDRPHMVAETTSVARILVNQAHTFGNGGGFNNSLPFTLSMGCGTWAGNSISENLSYKDFFNVTKVVTTIEIAEPDPTVLFKGLL